MTDYTLTSGNAAAAMARQTTRTSSPIDLLTCGDPTLWTALLGDLNEGVYATDRDRRILFWNQGAETISGFDAACMVGGFCRDNL